MELVYPSSASTSDEIKISDFSLSMLIYTKRYDQKRSLKNVNSIYFYGLHEFKCRSLLIGKFFLKFAFVV